MTLAALWFGARSAAISGAGPPVVQAPATRAFDLYDSFGPCQKFLASATSHFLHIGIALDHAFTDQAAFAAQGDMLPREEFAWLVAQKACETEPADEHDPECIRILRLDLKSAVLSAFLQDDLARDQAKAQQASKNHG